MAEIRVELSSNDNQEPIVINRSRLTDLSSLSQSTSSPDSIQYGTIANSGSIEMTDYNEDIKALIKDGTLNPSDVDVSLYVNNNLVQKHLSTDSNYDNADKTFNISLSNKVKDMETLKYGGYVYQDATISVFDLLKNVLGSFLGQTLTDASLEAMLSAKMIHPTDNSEVYLYEYAKEINIKYPSIEYGRTYRDVIDELCTILQCYMYVDDKDNIVFEPARPVSSIPYVNNAIRITKDKMYSPLKDAVILKNKFDGVEISETQAQEKVNYGDVIVSPTINSYNKIEQSMSLPDELNQEYHDFNFIYGIGVVGSIVPYAVATTKIKNYYLDGQFTIPQKSDDALQKVLNVSDSIFSSDGTPRFSIVCNYYKYPMSGIANPSSSTITEASIDSTPSETDDFNGYLSQKLTYSFTQEAALEIENVTAESTTTAQDESYINVTLVNDNYLVEYHILVGQETAYMGGGGFTEGGGSPYITSTNISGYYEKYEPLSVSISIYGNVREIVFSDSSASSTNIDSAKTIASVSTGKLVQNVTQIDSTQEGAWADGTKITDVIKSTILEDYEKGISNATVTVCCEDFYNLQNEKVIDWSQGEILKVGQVVFFTDDKYNDSTQRYWRITGRRFYWEGAPYCDLELQEIKVLEGIYVAGLYDANNKLVYNWDELVDNGYITVSNNAVTGSTPSVLNGSLLIPQRISEIGANAFNECSGLTSITIPENVTTIGNYAFNNCTNISTINYNAISVNDLSSENYAFGNVGTNTDGTILNIGEKVERIPAEIFCPNRRNNFSAPKITNINFAEDCVCSSIGLRAFQYCKYLQEITIPENIKTIGILAFYSCVNVSQIYFNATNMDDLTSLNYVFNYVGSYTSGIRVDIGVNVIKIPSYLFQFCEMINRIVFPQHSVCSSLGHHCFNGCLLFTQIILPESLNFIGSSAFEGCERLATVDLSFRRTLPVVELENVNAISSATTKIYVYSGLEYNYKGAPNWSNFADIIVGVQPV